MWSCILDFGFANIALHYAVIPVCITRLTLHSLWHRNQRSLLSMKELAYVNNLWAFPFHYHILAWRQGFLSCGIWHFLSYFGTIVIGLWFLQPLLAPPLCFALKKYVPLLTLTTYQNRLFCNYCTCGQHNWDATINFRLLHIIWIFLSSELSIRLTVLGWQTNVER